MSRRNIVIINALLFCIFAAASAVFAEQDYGQSFSRWSAEARPVRIAPPEPTVLHEDIAPPPTAMTAVRTVAHEAPAPGSGPAPTSTASVAASQKPAQTVAAAVSAPTGHGATLYNQLGCSACHSIDGTSRLGPTFKGLYGKTESLTTGETVKVDETYLTESIIKPNARIVQGFGPMMLAYEGRVSGEDLKALLSFLKDLR